MSDPRAQFPDLTKPDADVRAAVAHHGGAQRARRVARHLDEASLARPRFGPRAVGITAGSPGRNRRGADRD